ncbi:lipopolysaccharide biosynthesis protein [Cytophaga aurantiaca]|uniref:lipopolysaccharide biosynthesis protein n=1 Tax=Cytophaga aurantiaca TaxID=29530 RepID=UPI00035C4260|nr:polysaccharide biosynthesis C-terminal domain-containing protein [Cytophaga aurantiaca]
MGIIIKQSINNSIITYIGIGIGAINVLWLFPKYLNLEEIGLLRLIIDIPMLLAFFTQIGASSLSDRFYSHFKDGNKNNGFLFLILFYPLIGFILFAIGFIALKSVWANIYMEKSAILIDYFNFILPLTFFMMYIFIFEAYLRANFNISVSSFLREVFLRLFFTVVVILYHMNLINLDGMVYLYVISYATSLLFLVLYTKKINLLDVRPDFTLFNKSKVKEMGIYVLYLIPGVAGTMIISKIDSLMLGSMEGLTNVAVYSLAFFIGTVVEVPRKSLSMISIPLLSTASQENDVAKIDELYKKNSLIQLAAGMLIFLLIWINVDDLLSLIPKAETFSEGKYVILFIGLSKLFEMATSINGEIIQFSKYYRYNIGFVIALSILTVGANFIFIPIFSINGAALALLLNIILMNILKTIVVWNKIGVQPFSGKMIHIILFGILVCLLFSLLNYKADTILLTLLVIALKSLFIGILFVFVLLKFNVSDDISATMQKMFSKIPLLKK